MLAFAVRVQNFQHVHAFFQNESQRVRIPKGGPASGCAVPASGASADMDGDGYDDLIIGALATDTYDAYTGNHDAAGRAYLVLGPTSSLGEYIEDEADTYFEGSDG